MPYVNVCSIYLSVSLFRWIIYFHSFFYLLSYLTTLSHNHSYPVGKMEILNLSLRLRTDVHNTFNPVSCLVICAQEIVDSTFISKTQYMACRTIQEQEWWKLKDLFQILALPLISQRSYTNYLFSYDSVFLSINGTQ